jgi:hypothetical protein
MPDAVRPAALWVSLTSVCHGLCPCCFGAPENTARAEPVAHGVNQPIQNQRYPRSSCLVVPNLVRLRNMGRAASDCQAAAIEGLPDMTDSPLPR